VSLRPGQRGAVLATGLALLLVTTLLATAGIREATLELAKTGSEQGAMLAFAAAQTGLALTLAAGGFGHTAPRALPAVNLPDGTSWRGRVRFLGVAALPPAAVAEGPDTTGVAWHFAVETEGRGPRHARSRQRLQVYVRGGPPEDLARCLDPGCPVPLYCAEVCDTPPEAVPVPVAWHEIEDGR
jgi:hypothetical protein